MCLVKMNVVLFLVVTIFPIDLAGRAVEIWRPIVTLDGAVTTVLRRPIRAKKAMTLIPAMLSGAAASDSKRDVLWGIRQRRCRACYRAFKLWEQPLVRHSIPFKTTEDSLIRPHGIQLYPSGKRGGNWTFLAWSWALQQSVQGPRVGCE